MKYNKIFGPKLNGYNLQDSGNFFMDNIIYFHNLVLCILFVILILITWFLISTLLYFGNPKIYKNMYDIFYFYVIVLIYIRDFILYQLITNYDTCYILYRGIFRGFKRKPNYSFTKKNSIFIFFCKLIKVIKIEPYLSLVDYLPIVNNNKFLKNFLQNNNVEYRYYFYSDAKLEFIWTIFPSLVLFLLAIPSFGLLFSIEKVGAPELTIKVIGHQWYWEYQYMDYINFSEYSEKNKYTFIYKNKIEDNYIIESYMINDDDLLKGQFRLLEVDKKLILPINSVIRLLITSDDVLHSWAVPALGIKVDACPGRINELNFKIRDIGVYYGQCSELCGWYHGFMPIVIQSLKVDDFKLWALNSFLDIKYIKN